MVHPILVAADSMGEALKSVADANPTFMTTAEKATALVEVARLEARVGELKLRLLAAAADVAAESADRGPGAWLARHTLCRRDEGRAEERLAMALDRRWLMLGLAVREGRVNLAQARTIVTCLDALDDKPVAGVVTPEMLAAAEQHLVAQAEVFGPEELGRLGRRILDVVAPEVAEEAEARRLADLEAEAQRRTRMQMRRVGDGTTRLSARLPDAAASRLATCLEAFANPRKHSDGVSEAPPVGTDPVARLPYPRRLGQAFCDLLEAIDPTRLPLHGGDATNVVITIPLESLRADLGTADLLDGSRSVPGDDPTAGGLTAAQARRLPAPPRSFPLSSVARRRSSTWAGPDVCSTLPSARPCSCETGPAARRVVTSPAPGRRPTTGPRGAVAAPQTWSTGCCSAATITTASTTPPGPPNACPTATSDSVGGPRTGHVRIGA